MCFYNPYAPKCRGMSDIYPIAGAYIFNVQLGGIVASLATKMAQLASGLSSLCTDDFTDIFLPDYDLPIVHNENRIVQFEEECLAKS